ncbi:hypothetical protein K438DRAFT_1960205 [Mycena galopus ATCC 62051]|nr:hypothetical protein K438DRAFT_1960205 [Mycena galopus ATCC 62051]
MVEQNHLFLNIPSLPAISQENILPIFFASPEQLFIISTRSAIGFGEKMSGTGVTYYDEELKYLFCLLKALPDVIPSGDAYDFTGYVPDPEKVKDFGCACKGNLSSAQSAGD